LEEEVIVEESPKCICESNEGDKGDRFDSSTDYGKWDKIYERQNGVFP